MKDLFQKIEELKIMVDNGINAYFSLGDLHHKSYEGSWDISFSLPSYFETDRNKPFGIRIELHCYILCPDRHAVWSGDNLEEVIKQAKKDIAKWVDEICS